jgi:murein L,D-transpeptidase YcbB/YkuD
MKKRIFIIGFVLLLMGLQGFAPLVACANETKARVALRYWLEGEASQRGDAPELRAAIVRFYKARQFQPAWMGPDGLKQQGHILLKSLKNASGEMLPELKLYVKHLEAFLLDDAQFTSVLNDFPLETLMQAEVGMTQIALNLAVEHNIVQENYGWEKASFEEELLADKLSKSLSESIWKELISAAQPGHRVYWSLKKALERYETIQLLGGWPQIPKGPKIIRGKRDSRVPVLRERLLISGDMGLEYLSADETYDEFVADAVQRFQGRHGLKADGVVGLKTLAELNTSVQTRIDQIRLNMVRWHSMPDRLGDRYLLLNIPSYHLKVVENHREVHSMRAIVGKKERQTPVMSAKMTYLEINPYWNIPQKIARKDLLPKIHNDPQYLIRQKIQVFESWKKDAPVLDPLSIDWKLYSHAFFPFRLRQEPASTNALGRVKFMFPNQYSVYIHDTPAKSLFKKVDRSFSSGCVRVEQPLVLAEYLLTGQHWNEKRIRATLKGRKRQVVALKEPISVHLIYMTAWADESGSVHFYKDLYGRDRQLLAELNRAKVYLSDFEIDQMSLGSILGKAHKSVTRSSDQRADDMFPFGTSDRSHAAKSKGV